jgi:restriction endonuclease S subunit
MALRVKHTYIDPYYLLSFLLSSVGQDQLRNSSKHVSLSRLDTHSLAAIEVPLLPYSIQQRIGKLVREAVAKRLRSRVLLQQVLSVFPQYVSQVSSPSSLTVPFATTLRIKRLDAEYYWLSSQAVSHQYKKEPISVPLGEIASFVRGIEVGSTSYTTQGNLFIRVGNITPFGLIWKSQKHITATLYKKLTRTYTPHVAEILLVKDGKPGVCCVLGKEIAGILSEGIVRVQVAKFDPYYIAACLQSDFCRRQIAQSIDGTLVPHLKLETITCLQIPILSPEEQSIVGDLMQNMYKAFEASKSLWEKAFQFVEGRDR